ncbi:unnamed protein product [Oikopleura dioica]|uniref:Uncharacterized protein n=1 Tax=Oikopleura dioica TaxID=34765 RepID=E4XVA4_OIKDI|nr:unnamed protein product [Oikopleura dioica]
MILKKATGKPPDRKNSIKQTKNGLLSPISDDDFITHRKKYTIWTKIFTFSLLFLFVVLFSSFWIICDWRLADSFNSSLFTRIMLPCICFVISLIAIICITSKISIKSTKITQTNGERFALPCVEDGDTSVCASFDRRGRCVYAGNSKGKVFIICAKKFKLLKAFKIGNSSQGVKQIKCTSDSGCFLVNSVDRVIRVYDSEQIVSDYSIPEGEAPCVSTIEPIQRLQDLVNRTLWKTCVFSGDGMFVCAGSAKQHQIYIWEKATETKAVSQTQLVKILEGTRGEQLLDVVWHPVRPIVVSVSNGMISVWSRNQVENWSAFAPEFTELDENVEYDEKESEFDEEDEDKSLPPDEAELFQDIEIDVEKVEKIEAFFSSDEEDFDDGCIYIPVAPDVDDPEDNPALPIKDCTEVDLTKKKSTKRKKSSKIGRPKKTR